MSFTNTCRTYTQNIGDICQNKPIFQGIIKKFFRLWSGWICKCKSTALINHGHSDEVLTIHVLMTRSWNPYVTQSTEYRIQEKQCVTSITCKGSYGDLNRNFHMLLESHLLSCNTPLIFLLLYPVYNTIWYASICGKAELQI